jgi:hypothetical protein
MLARVNALCDGVFREICTVAYQLRVERIYMSFEIGFVNKVNSLS